MSHEDEFTTKHDVYNLAKLILIGMCVQLVVIGYVFYQSYQGRADVVSSSRRACERGKLDRRLNASGWRTAEKARLETAAKTLHISYEAVKAFVRAKPRPDDLPDLDAARKYDHIAAGQEHRSRIVCAHAFPKASFLP